MSTLRSLRSITNLWDSGKHSRQHQDAHAPTSVSSGQSTGTVKRHRLQKASPVHRSSSNLLDVSVNNPGTFTLHHTQSEHPLTEFRRRLARKASTFSLRTRRRQGEREQDEAKEEEKFRELVLLKGGKSGIESEQERTPTVDQTVKSYQQEDQATPTQNCEKGDRSVTRTSSQTTVRVWDATETPSLKELPPLPTTANHSEATLAQQDLIRRTQESYISQEVASGKISVKKMASEQVQPPVPYTRLKEITESACEAAFSDAQSYVHADTGKWNTTIINSILGALVQETTQSPPAGSSAPAQPHFKYVVNSTIIQHAASSSSSSAAGRRGMHAASGAYWNNEKDGMWSFKYPGADSKGLDVVVGIIWVWVG
ncbi:hypothetical protein H2200_007594 [Cladophialophora chaetospira]|uniref:Dynein light chain n=1 Tax=Cladophialophora chaetospira TaxID=386627 RepID=A0AA38X6G8_9EURO|nr:hypothetical protein H2200_007594 [Cladophialophora chaetospira]